MVTPRRHQIGQTFLMGVERTRRHLVKRGFPEMENGTVNQEHPSGTLSSPEPSP